MILVIHHNNALVKILNKDREEISHAIEKDLVSLLFSIAKSHPNQLILWCNRVYADYLNFDDIGQIFHHPKVMASYSVSKKSYLPPQIGYVEDSPFINVKYDVSYPTWLMSSDVGGVSAQVLNALNPKNFKESDLDLFLNSFAKKAMPTGLLCYSTPELLLGNMKSKIEGVEASNFQLYKFVKEHYKTHWVFFLFLASIVFERKFHFFSFIASFFYPRKNINTAALSKVQILPKKINNETKTIDVIIPTIGRKSFLYDVLCDLKSQTHLPVRVIVVEQNPDKESVSELDYLYDKVWPFAIKHIFTHRAGACNARNIALSYTESEWVFLADDDNRFNTFLIADVFKKIDTYGNKVATTAYPQKGEIIQDKNVVQWPTFGAGNSFVKRDLLENIKFNTSFEFGYGEDTDFGMQLRNKGIDVLYFPEPHIVHLKAPMGGFRTKPVFEWQDDVDQPKPSPTIMLHRQKHTTPFQLKGYKVLLLLRFYNKQQVKNPFGYLRKMKRSWNSSLVWANKLDRQ